MASFWNNLKSSVKKGVTVAAEKTEEYGKVGRLKLDIVNLKKQADRSYRQIGEVVYTHIKSGGKSSISQNADVLKEVEALDEVLAEIRGKEDEIDTIHAEAEKKSQSRESESDTVPAEENPADQADTTPEVPKKEASAKAKPVGKARKSGKTETKKG